MQLARELQLSQRDMREAFCILSHCACSETPPSIPLVRAEMFDASTEEIMSGVFRGEVKVEAFGRDLASIIGFFGWLENYLPIYEKSGKDEEDEEDETPTESFPRVTEGDRAAPTEPSFTLPEEDESPDPDPL